MAAYHWRWSKHQTTVNVCTHSLTPLSSWNNHFVPTRFVTMETVDNGWCPRGSEIEDWKLEKKIRKGKNPIYSTLTGNSLYL